VSMTTSGSSPYKLICSKTAVDASKFSTLLKQELLSFEEVDFSECNLTGDSAKGDTLKVVLELCSKCPKLRILKLFKNQLDDKAADRLADMLQKVPDLEELHLSHNIFSSSGVKRLVAAAAEARPEEKVQPLWLRLEQNSVASPDTVCSQLEDEFSVCKRSDTVRCTVRVCMNKKKVHLPFFNLQRPVFVSRAEREAQAAAAAKAKSPAAIRTISGGVAQKPAAPKPCAWGQGPKVAPTPLEFPAKKEDEEKAQVAQDLTPAWKAGSRPSIVLDKFGHRRTMPEQLDGVDPAPFVCSLCHFLMSKPVITRCSHLFCDFCFKQWVSYEVEQYKSQKAAAAPVPQIRCPQTGCKELLKKNDVEPAADGKTSGVQLFQRLRNNLVIRCVHHKDHHKLDFGKDAERVLAEQGVSCSWSGAPPQYEEHMAAHCPVENFLKSENLAQQGADLNVNNIEGARSYEAEPEPEASVEQAPEGAQTAQDAGYSGSQAESNHLNEGEVRVAMCDYIPSEGDEGQIRINRDDYIKVLQVTDNGWAAGIRLCRTTLREMGEAGWFPKGYLKPPETGQSKLLEGA